MKTYRSDSPVGDDDCEIGYGAEKANEGHVDGGAHEDPRADVGENVTVGIGGHTSHHPLHSVGSHFEFAAIFSFGNRRAAVGGGCKKRTQLIMSQKCTHLEAFFTNLKITQGLLIAK